MRFATEIAKCAPGPILDLGCGIGRHSLLFASHGCNVVSIDLDMERLKTLSRLSGKSAKYGHDNHIGTGHIAIAQLNLSQVPWPFKPRLFGAVIAVHFYSTTMLYEASRLLATDGYFFVETFGGHGNNFQALPKRDQLRQYLGTEYDIEYYSERDVGPRSADAVSVRFLAKRRRTGDIPKNFGIETPQVRLTQGT